MQAQHRVGLTENESLVCRALAAQPRDTQELTVPEIAAVLEEDFDVEFIAYSTITDALRDLRRDGFIERRRLRKPGEPYARVYWLTARGRAAAVAW